MRRLILIAAALVCVSGALAADAVAHGRRLRRWPVTIANPGPPNYALARLDFDVPATTPVTVRLSGPSGGDYIDVASLTGTPRLQLMVLALDRATELMDPSQIRLTVRLAGASRQPRTLRLTDGLGAREQAGEALCQGAAPSTGSLRALWAAGSPLSGFTAAGAIAQGYAYSCGLAYEAAFVQAVRGESTPTPTPIEPVCPPPCGSITGPPVAQYACPLAPAIVCPEPLRG